jgi:uncharacterized protein involved in type VI secretion and phage assembly
MSSHPFDHKRRPLKPSQGWYGVYSALVTDNQDPENLGRLKILFEGQEYWARLATLMAGNNRGTWFIPDVKDEVLIAFEAGDPRMPYVIGMLWNKNDRPPESMDSSGSHNRKVLRSRNGIKITLDDAVGQENLIVETPAGQKLSMKDGPGSIMIEDSNGNSIQLASDGVTVSSTGKVTIHANAVEVSTSMLTVNAGVSKFSGVVQCDTLISNSVVSSSYSPGAGNIS